MPSQPLLDLSAFQAAPRMLGATLTRTLPDGSRLQGKIVETEAYDQSDPASHSFKGLTKRTAAMFGPPGRLYVYFTYGIHYCCNVVVGPAGSGQAVLIRALEPLQGIAQMEQHRGRGSGLTDGPAKLCQALQIDLQLNGHDLTLAPLRLELGPDIPPSQITQTTRVGISQATNQPWRFYIKDSPFVSVR